MLAIAAAVALMNCDPGFKPETLISDLRLIGIQATPADLHPGEETQLEALVLDPLRTGSTVLWIGCEPDPFAQNRSPCADPAVLSDPSALTGGTGTLPPGVTLIGFNDQATYRVPAGLFDVLPADDQRRQSGTVGIVIAFAISETVSPSASQEELQAVFARVQRKETKSIVGIFRINVSESSQRNTNPVVSSIVVAGETWPTNARVTVRPGEPVMLDIVAPDSSFEPYTQVSPSGVVDKTERILSAWYSSSGRFTETSTALREEVRTIFKAPTESGAGTLFTVFRDTRGGNAWREWSYFVCDDAAPTPEISSVDWPADQMNPVTLHGNNVSSVLDVIVDGVALEDGSFSSATGAWTGYFAAGAMIGEQRGTVNHTNCTRSEL